MLTLCPPSNDWEPSRQAEGDKAGRKRTATLARLQTACNKCPFSLGLSYVRKYVRREPKSYKTFCRRFSHRFDKAVIEMGICICSKMLKSSFLQAAKS